MFIIIYYIYLMYILLYNILIYIILILFNILKYFDESFTDYPYRHNYPKKIL